MTTAQATALGEVRRVLGELAALGAGLDDSNPDYRRYDEHRFDLLCTLQDAAEGLVGALDTAESHAQEVRS
ncbi:hypothetical protein [Nocardia niwae]|uniref:hypothetical protein n=1 Tax=Nocardia niwae TaxID=626084 RepID=UPI003409D905